MDEKKCSVKLFVGGIQPTCQERDLRIALKDFLSHITSIDIKMKNGYLNRGYAFIFVDNHAVADQMVKQKIQIGERVLQIQDTNKNSQEKEEYKLKRLYLKNIPAATCDKELNGFFQRFGDIRSSYIIKDLNGNTKDYGFIDFEHVQDVDRCLDFLRNKPLVLRGQKIRVRRFIKVEDKKSQAGHQTSDTYQSFRSNAHVEDRYVPFNSNSEVSGAKSAGNRLKKQDSISSTYGSHDDTLTADYFSGFTRVTEPSPAACRRLDSQPVWSPGISKFATLAPSQVTNPKNGPIRSNYQPTLNQTVPTSDLHGRSSCWADVSSGQQSFEEQDENNLDSRTSQQVALCSKFAGEELDSSRRESAFSKHSASIDWNHRPENIQFKVGGSSPAVRDSR